MQLNNTHIAHCCASNETLVTSILLLIEFWQLNKIFNTPYRPSLAFYLCVTQYLSKGCLSPSLKFVASSPQAARKTKWLIFKGTEGAVRYASTPLINSVHNTFVRNVRINTSTYSLFSHDKDGSVDLPHNMVSTPRCLRTNPKVRRFLTICGVQDSRSKTKKLGMGLMENNRGR